MRASIDGEVSGHMLSNKVIVQDIPKTGKAEFSGTPLWHKGPSFDDLEGDALPDFAGQRGRGVQGDDLGLLGHQLQLGLLGATVRGLPVHALHPGQ